MAKPKQQQKCSSGCGKTLTLAVEQQRGTCNDCWRETQRSSEGEKLEEWQLLESEGRSLVETIGKSQWALGDLAIRVSTNAHYGQHGLELYAENIGIEFTSLLRYRDVAKAYENATRVALSWTHHRLIAARQDRHDWLKAAVRNDWSVRQMVEEIHKTDAEDRKAKIELEKVEAEVADVETAMATPVVHEPQLAPQSQIVESKESERIQAVAEEYVAQLPYVPENPIELAHGAIWYWVFNNDGDSTD